MKIASFSLLTALALLYAGLTLAETMTYHKWEQAINDQKYTQAEVAYFDHLNMVLDEMVRRMAIASQHDPVMAQLLKEHNINVVVDNGSAQPAPVGFDTTPPVNPSSTPPSKPDQTPAAPNSSQQ